jgi:arylsulfatase A-like enzyme
MSIMRLGIGNFMGIAGTLLMALGPAQAGGSLPNFIIILTDDQGFGDLGCNGSKLIKTPHIDRMAAEGMRFTDFYATSPICTPTRASLMTACYPSRVGLGTPLHTPDRVGLNEEEITVAELLRTRGYLTACIGKWHLGHYPQFYPTRHGFDHYYGTPLGHCFFTKGMRGLKRSEQSY